MNAHCSSLVLTHCEWVAISLTLEHFVSIHAMPDRVTAHNSNGWSETAARLPESVCVIKNANSIGRILLNFKHTFSEALSLSISVFAGCVAHQSTTYRSIDWSLAECQTNGEWQPATTTSSTATLLSPPIHGIDKETHPNECESDAGERKKMRRHDYAWMLAGTEHVSTKFYHKIYFNLICVSAYDCMLWQWTNSLG